MIEKAQIQLQYIHGFCRGILTVSGPAIEPPCHRSHIFQTHFSLSLFQTEIMAYGEDYQQPASYTEISCTVKADLQVYSCKRALLSARNPHPTFITSKHHKGVMLEWMRYLSYQAISILSKSVYPGKPGASMTRSKKSQPARLCGRRTKPSAQQPAATKE